MHFTAAENQTCLYQFARVACNSRLVIKHLVEDETNDLKKALKKLKTKTKKHVSTFYGLKKNPNHP